MKISTRKKLTGSNVVILLIIAIVLLSACANVTNVEDCLQGEMYGFWNGLWHGFIAPFSFIISLFKDDVAVYAINNNGNWYNFGFILGAAIIFGGGGKASNSGN